MCAHAHGSWRRVHARTRLQLPHTLAAPVARTRHPPHSPTQLPRISNCLSLTNRQYKPLRPLKYERQACAHSSFWRRVCARPTGATPVFCSEPPARGQARCAAHCAQSARARRSIFSRRSAKSWTASCWKRRQAGSSAAVSRTWHALTDQMLRLCALPVQEFARPHRV